MNVPSDRHWNRAQRYLSEGNLDAARISLESMLQRDSDTRPRPLLLGDIAWEEDRVRESARHARAAAEAMPADRN